MLTIIVNDKGTITKASRIEPSWLTAESDVVYWVDMAAPSDADLDLLTNPLKFHELAVSDAKSIMPFPKIESFKTFLYLILHGIDVGKGKQRIFTHDVDFFITRNGLVTVHDGLSRSINNVLALCEKHALIMAEGPVGLLHRIVDEMVDHYQPAMGEFEQRLEKLENDAFSGKHSTAPQLLALKHELTSLRRILTLQRDAIGRLARREFGEITDEMSYRFRDVYDHVVRLSEESIIAQERITGIFEVNLSVVSNRLNQVMKVLTVMSTIFLPLTVLTGLWGMNIQIPNLPGGTAAQFWWVCGIMLALIVIMLLAFRSKKWI